MKKILLIITVLILVVLAGAAVFIATLDLDKYRPQIVSKIEDAIGLPVQLENISLTWHQGLALSLHGLGIVDPATKQTLLTFDSAKVLVDLAPLINRRIQMTTLYLERPVVRLVRRPDGRIQGFQTQTREKKESSNASAALAFFVGKIQLEKGEIFYRDETQPRPTEITIRNVDIELKNVALNSPIRFNIKTAALSRSQNVEVTGILKISPSQQKLENVHGEIDLSSLDFNEIAKLLPTLAAQSSNRISGNLTLDVQDLILSPEGFRNVQAEVHVTGGNFQTEALEIQKISADIFASTGNIEIKSVSADYAGGKMNATGNVNLKTPVPLVAFETRLLNLSLERAIPVQEANAPQLKGILSAAFQGTLSTASALRTVAGEGSLQLDQGRIENLNILREVFKKLSIIPGLTDKLMGRLPENYKDRLEARDTAFENLQVPFTVQQGVVLIQRLDLRSDSFALQGAARLGLESQMLEGQASLFIEPDLSLALIQSVQELQSLADQNNMIQIPLNFQGRLPKVSVIPDLQYIASRLAVVKSRQVLNDFFQPKDGTSSQTGVPAGAAQTQTSATTPSSTGTTQTGKYPKGKDLLGALLQSALAPQDNSQQQ